MSGPRIIEGIPYEEYAKDPAINGSLLAAVHTESLLTVRAMMHGEVKRESDRMDHGEAFHALTLEGRKAFVERPDCYPAPADHAKVKKKEIEEGHLLPWNANAGYCEKWSAQQSLTVLSSTKAKNLYGMRDAVMGSPELLPFMKGRSELSVFADISGRALKIRVDKLSDDPSGPVIDLKMAKSARPADFVKQSYNLLYHLKAALYLDVLKAAGISRKQFWLVAVEEEYPHNLYICKMEDSGIGLIDHGRKIYRAAYHKLMTAIENDCWPSYGSSEAEDHLTPWMMGEIEANS